MPYYFAYGSCMNDTDLLRTDKRAKKVRTGILHDYRLAYTWYSRHRRGGVADVVKSPGVKVEGVIFEVPDFDRLDAREGHPHIYKRIRLNGGKKQVPIYTYEVVRKSDHEYVPSPYYFGLIADGAKGLSRSYQEQLKAHYQALLQTGLLSPVATVDAVEWSNDYSHWGLGGAYGETYRC